MSKAKTSINLNIQPFDGNPSTVEFFFDQLEDLQQLNNYSEKEMFAIFKTKLLGPALHFYLDSQFNSQAKKLAEIKNEFIQFFASKENKNVAFRSLDKMKLEHNESVRNFSYRLNKNLKLAHPTVDDASLQILKFTYFMNALPKNIHVKLLEEGISDFGNALSRAEQLQNIYNFTESPTTPVPVTLPVYNMEHSNNSFPKSGSSDYKHSETENKRKSFRNRNFSAYGKHHPKQNVKLKQTFYKQNLRNSFRHRTINQCAFCGRHGHLMKTCFEFKSFFQSMNQANSHDGVNMLQNTANGYQANQQNTHEHNDGFSKDKSLN